MTSKTISKMTREDFVNTVKASMFFAMTSTEEFIGELIILYMFLQEKGLADECQNRKDLQDKAEAIIKEGKQNLLDEMRKVLDEENKGKKKNAKK